MMTPCISVTWVQKGLNILQNHNVLQYLPKNLCIKPNFHFLCQNYQSYDKKHTFDIKSLLSYDPGI